MLTDYFFFYYRGFLPLTLTTYRIAGERRESAIVILHYFQPLRNIQTCICNFACEMAITYLFTRLLLQWNLPLYRITIWLIDDVMLIFVCLLDELILGFRHGNLTRETGRLQLESTIILVLQPNQRNTYKTASEKRKTEKVCNLFQNILFHKAL